MCEWSGRYDLGDVKIFILKQVEVLYSKTYGSIWVTFRVNERVKVTFSHVSVCPHPPPEQATQRMPLVVTQEDFLVRN